MPSTPQLDELVSCLGSVMISSSSQTQREYAQALPLDDANSLRQRCLDLRVDVYEPTDLASYAMGVSFQSKVLARHDLLDWVDFLNGLLRSQDKAVKQSSAGLDRILTLTLLGAAEASQQYLESLRSDTEYREVSGVFYRLLPGQSEASDEDTATATAELASATPVLIGADPGNRAPTSNWLSAFATSEVCTGAQAGEDKPRRVRFHRVRPIHTEIADSTAPAQPVDCIEFDSDEVIRGWRLLMNELEPNRIYDVLVPSELAYGSTGVSGQVEPDEHLRFLMKFEPVDD